VEEEADFYGAMDGASKFVRGDAIAAILITLINVLGGFAIGMAQKGMSVSDALERYTLLSIGDGLVSQVPALITSTAAGILITRAASKNDLGHDLGRQLLFYPRALWVLTGMLGLMAVIPGLPMVPFVVLAGVTGSMAHVMGGQGAGKTDSPHRHRDPDREKADGAPKETSGATSEKIESLLALDALQVELGYGLVALADTRKGGDLLSRVTGVRRNFAQEMGVVIPAIRLRDNLQLGPNEYRFVLKGNPVARGELMPGHWLAMNGTSSKTVLRGTPTTEPVFHLPATWITEVERKNAEVSGYTVVDAASVLVTHLSETVKRNAHEILSRQDVQLLLDNLKQTHSTVVNELIPGQLTVGQVQRVLQNLLAEGVSIRNLAGILEKVSDQAGVTKNPDELSEYARRALGGQLTRGYVTGSGTLRAITLDPKLEQQIVQGLRQTTADVGLALEPKLARHIMERLSKGVQELLAGGHAPVVLCAPQIRLGFRRFFETAFSDLVVLSYAEVPSRQAIESAGIIPCLEG
jgi:flagellar biosynthesis protein FlhA